MSWNRIAGVLWLGLGLGGVPFLFPHVIEAQTRFQSHSAPEGFELVEDGLTLTCAGEAPPSCRVVTRATFRNTRAAAAPFVLASSRLLMCSYCDDVEVVVDGVPQRPDDRGATPAVDIAPNATVVVEYVSGFSLYASSSDQPALNFRHPLFSDAPPYEHTIEYSRDTLRSAPGLTSTITVTPPPGWEVTMAGKPRSSERVVYEIVGERWIDAEVSFFQHPDRVLHNGGPIAGLGGTFGQGWHLRLGYEVALHAAAFISATVETDFDGQWEVVPLLEGVVSSRTVLTTMSFGVGLPVRISPDARPGFRFQISAGVVVIGVASFDYFPADQHLRVTLLGQIGL